MTVKLMKGDCREKLQELPDESIDFIATDPPYGIKFMGKKWDSIENFEEFFIPIWKECLRVLKSGSFAFVMSSPRADVLSKQIIALEKAGFRVDFTPIYWAYASGFSKAKNLSKAADKRNTRTQETYKPFANYLKKMRKKQNLSKSDIDNLLGTNTAYSWWEGRKDGIQLPKKELYLKLKEILKLDDRFDSLIEREEAKREKIGERKKKESWEYKNNVVYMTGEKDDIILDITLPATDKAKQLDGSFAGFQPKPAVEVIIVAMKPLSERSYLEQALKWCESDQVGLGGTWLDECKIPFMKLPPERIQHEHHKKVGEGSVIYGLSQQKNKYHRIDWEPDKLNGRFPANLLVSDDILNNGINHKSGSLKLDYNLSAEKTKNVYGFMPRIDKEHIGDSGSFSRFFDLDRWFSEKTKQLPLKVQRIFPFLKVPKTSKSEKNKGVPKTERVIGHNRFDKCGDCGGYILQNQDRPSACKCKIPKREDNKIKGNFHPTVKPIKLMSYLITLALGKSKLKDKRIVLDCFAGSGTTAIAARLLGFNAIVIENNPKYFELMKSRIDFHLEQKKLFDFSGVESET